MNAALAAEAGSSIDLIRPSLKYMPRNPVKRGLAERPDDWPWRSFRHYATGEAGTVEIESAKDGVETQAEWNALHRFADDGTEKTRSSCASTGKKV